MRGCSPRRPSAARKLSIVRCSSQERIGLWSPMRKRATRRTCRPRMAQPAAMLGPLDVTGMSTTCRRTVATTSSCTDIVIELLRCAPSHPCHHPMLSHPPSPHALCEALRPAQHLTCSSHARRRSLPEAPRRPVRSAAARGRVGGAHVAARRRESALARGTAASRLVASWALSMAVQLFVAMPMQCSAHARCPMHAGGMYNVCARPVARGARVITYN